MKAFWTFALLLTCFLLRGQEEQQVQTINDFRKLSEGSLSAIVSRATGAVNKVALEAKINGDAPIKTVVPKLIAELAKDGTGAEDAAFALGIIGKDAAGAVSDLAKMLRSKDSTRRAAAMIALMGLKEDAASAIPELTKLLHDESPDLRGMCVLTLGAIGPAAKSATPSVLDAIDDKAVSENFVAAISRILPTIQDALPELSKWLKYPRPDVRIYALSKLGNLGREAKEVRALVSDIAKSDPEESVKVAAEKALVLIDAEEVKR